MSSLSDYAKTITNHCLSDGAIIYGDPSLPYNPAHRYWVRPYFSNIAAAGLVDAYAATQDYNYIARVKAWMDWYVAHADLRTGIVTDFFGNASPQLGKFDWTATTPDSLDAYPATFLSLAAKLLPYVKEKQWVDSIRGVLPVFLSAVTNLVQANGPARDLALNFSPANLFGKVPVAFTEDNCEVYSGLMAASALGVTNGVSDPKSLAQRLLGAMNYNLFANLQPVRHYDLGVQPDAPIPVQKANITLPWYPGQQIQLMAVATLPMNSDLAALFSYMAGQYSSEIPAVIAKPGDQVKELENLDIVVLAGLACAAIPAPSFVNYLKSLLQAYNPGVGVAIHDIGRACTLLS